MQNITITTLFLKTLSVFCQITCFIISIENVYIRQVHKRKTIYITDNYANYMDEYCLALLLKGVCLKFRSQFLQAEQCFIEIITK